MVLDRHPDRDGWGDEHFGLSHPVAPQISLEVAGEASRKLTIDSRIVVPRINGRMIHGVEGIRVCIVVALIIHVVVPLYVVELSSMDLNVRSVMEKRRHKDLADVERSALQVGSGEGV